MRTIRIDISVRTITVVLVTALSVWLFFRLWQVVLLVLTSLLFTAALMPVVDRLERRGLKRGIAVMLIMLSLFLLVIVVGILIVPVISEQIKRVVDNLPAMRERAVVFLIERHATELAKDVREFDPTPYLGAVVVNAGSQAFGALVTVFTLLVLTAYMLLDIHRLGRMVFSVAPPNTHGHIRALTAGLNEVVGGYIRGQFTTSSCIAIFTFVLFLALKLENPAAFAIFAAIADVIPVIGVFVLVIPLAVAGASVALWKGVVVAAALVLYTQFENQFLVQFVFGKSLDLPAVIVFLGILVGGTLFGVAGALLSLPATAAIRVIAQYWLDARRASASENIASDADAPVAGAAE
jgi:predicted PurR-regulated permease PerM